MTNVWCEICIILVRLAPTFVRAILHDRVVYPDPDSFKPERFINPDGSLRDDPVLTALFGFGKRICPGRHLADATIFIVIASLLSVFNIKKGNNTNGTPDDYPFTGSGVRYGYRVSITTWEKMEELTSGVSLPVVRAHSLTRSSQEIEKRKSSSSLIPGFHEPFRSFVISCLILLQRLYCARVDTVYHMGPIVVSPVCQAQ
jgi:hypothetical protein